LLTINRDRGAAILIVKLGASQPYEFAALWLFQARIFFVILVKDQVPLNQLLFVPVTLSENIIKYLS
jgi:hypothetical protein